MLQKAITNPKGAAIDAAAKAAKDPNKALNDLAALGQRKAEQGTSAEKTMGSRLENAAKSTAGGMAGGVAGQEIGGTVGKQAGEEAGKEVGRQAADKMMDGASALTMGLSDVARPLAKKAGESIGGAVGKTAGGLAGNAAGGAVGSELGSKAADQIPGTNAGKTDENGDEQTTNDKDDLLDKGLKNVGKKATDGVKQANNVRKAMDALNPANIAAKAGAAAQETLKQAGGALWNAIKATPKAIADAAVKGTKAVISGAKALISKGATALGHIGLHGTAATVTSATISATMLTGGVAGTAVTVNHFLPKNDSNLFAICLAYDQKKAKSDASEIANSKGGDSKPASEGQKDAENKVISVMRVLKYTDIQIAGTISNFRAEGSSDPTVFEYGKDWGGQVFGSSDDQGGAYKKTSQKEKAGNWSAENIAMTTGKGFGYGQMTPAGPFFAWAKKNNKDPFDPGVQLAYQMSSVTNNKYPWETYRKATADLKDPTAAASWFFYGWEYPGYSGQASAAPAGVQQYGPAHTKEAEASLAYVKTVKTDESYANKVISAIDNDVKGGAQDDEISSVDTAPAEVDKNRPSFCDDNGADSKKESKNVGSVEDGTGVAPASAGNRYMKPSELPEDLKKFVGIDPAQYGMSYGSWKGWEAAQPLWSFQNPGILTTCTQIPAALGYKLWGITNVMGNGYEVVDHWKAKDPKGTVSNKPSQGAIYSFSPGSANGNNHTGIVSHVFKNGDILAVETGIVINPSPDHDQGTWSYHIYTKARMEDLKTTYFKPSTQMAKPSGNHFFG